MDRPGLGGRRGIDHNTWWWGGGGAATTCVTFLPCQSRKLSSISTSPKESWPWPGNSPKTQRTESPTVTSSLNSSAPAALKFKATYEHRPHDNR